VLAVITPPPVKRPRGRPRKDGARPGSVPTKASTAAAAAAAAAQATLTHAAQAAAAAAAAPLLFPPKPAAMPAVASARKATASGNKRTAAAAVASASAAKKPSKKTIAAFTPTPLASSDLFRAFDPAAVTSLATRSFGAVAPVMSALRPGVMYDAPGARGIANIGNTCFLNSIVQALAHASVLRDFWLMLPQRLSAQATAPSDAQALASSNRTMRRTATMLGDKRLQIISASYDNDGSTVESVTCAMQDVIKQMWQPTELLLADSLAAASASGIKRKVSAVSDALNSDADRVRTQVLSAESLLSVIWRCMPKFGGYQQHDAHEFLRYLLDRVDIELRNIGEPLPPTLSAFMSPFAPKPAHGSSPSSSSSSSLSSAGTAAAGGAPTSAPSFSSSLPRRAAAVAAAAKTSSIASASAHSAHASSSSAAAATTAATAAAAAAALAASNKVALGARNSLRLATAASSREPPPPLSLSPAAANGKSAQQSAQTNGGPAASAAAAAASSSAASAAVAQPLSFVKSMFGATVLSAVRCDGCKLLSKQHELHLDLSLDVPMDAASVTLAQCLDRYTTSCRLDKADKYKCAQCRKPMPATKRVTLESLPRILCLHLKRFRWQPPLPPKVNTNVTFPAELDMMPYVDQSVRDTMTTSTQYRLFAVVNHHGKACGSGHYTCVTRDDTAVATIVASTMLNDDVDDDHAINIDGDADDSADSQRRAAAFSAAISGSVPTWIEHDDRTVRRVAFEGSVVTPQAYLLFYERADAAPMTPSLADVSSEQPDDGADRAFAVKRARS
jgi:ubiquitin C-terminal hydrolase